MSIERSFWKISHVDFEKRVVDDLMELSATKGQFSPSVVEEIMETVAKRVHALYISTTE